MDNFEEEYRRIFETPLEEIKQDIFFRADNFQNEKWYGDFLIYQAIGICTTDRDCVLNLQKALKIMGYSTQTKERNGQIYLMPKEEVQKQPITRKREDRER